MKRILKKNQIVITTLAIMIAAAGYLNYSGRILEEEVRIAENDDSVLLLTDQNITDDTYTENYTDISSLDGEEVLEVSSAEAETSVTGIGDAVLANASLNNAVLASAKLNREQIRSKNKETLMEVINHADLGDDQKQEAVSAMTDMTMMAEKEAAAELLLEANGFVGSVVSISEDCADVVVNAAELSDAQRAQIEDIVKRKTDVEGEKIIITPCLHE